MCDGGRGLQRVLSHAFCWGVAAGSEKCPFWRCPCGFRSVFWKIMMLKHPRYLIVYLFLIVACIGNVACQEESAGRSPASAGGVSTAGRLPEQTEPLLDEEWKVFRAKHPDLDEKTAQRQFHVIQVLSEKARASRPKEAQTEATWALRRALAERWLKVEVEDVYSPESVKDDLIQEGIDAYAFESGHPALVTASHILIQPEDRSTDAERLAVISEVHRRLSALSQVTDEDLSREAVHLIRMGYKVDVNLDLEFPRYPMQNFLGEQLSYRSVVESFAAAAFSLDASHPLSQVVPSEFGYHIILFKQRTDEKKPKIDEVRDYMVSRIVAQGRKIVSEQYLNDLQSHADIRIDEKKLKELLFHE